MNNLRTQSRSLAGRLALGALLLVALAAPNAAQRPGPPKPASHTVRSLEGWTVRVDDRLLAPPNDVLGTRALLYDGSRVRHYGLTGAKEFFAEMTEAYFGLGRFLPLQPGGADDGRAGDLRPAAGDLGTGCGRGGPAGQGRGTPAARARRRSGLSLTQA